MSSDKSSTHPKVTYDPNHHWFRKWLRLDPHVLIGGDEDPYLKRWLVLPRNKFPINIYLHKFCHSDDDRALHDHPWPWWSILLKGQYLEYTKEPGNPHPRKRFSLVRRPATSAHRVALVNGTRKDGTYGELPAWTLFITGKKQREWGFHCPQGWMHWEKFTEGGTPTDARNSVGCGEMS